MLNAIRHRGPDEEGQFIADRVAMGCRRLSIIDLADGQQPMFAAERQIAAVANAEIYNHDALRADLTAQGARFGSRCDVEVIPHLYARDGLDLARGLNGQFAFAVYDTARDRLVLGRDQTGIAPMFWARVRDGILFGSEIKALLAHPEIARKLDPAGLDQILTYPGLVSPRTMFHGVHALRPGHLLVVERGAVREEKYWDYDFPAAPMADGDEAALLDELDAALRGAVARRLVADVPVGVYISGGLDSALIAAMAHQIAPDTARHSFSITFPDCAIDEARWQAIVRDQIGSVHHQVTFSEDDILQNLRQIVVSGETALKESYNACTLVLARLVAAQGMRVVLTGEGADELFGGYVGYRLDLTRETEFCGDIEEMIEEETRARLWGDGGFFYERDYAANADLTGALLCDGLLARRAEFSTLSASPVDHAQLAGRSAFHKRSYLDLKLRLPDHLLADHSDRVAYCASVEARYPFLDPHVIDVARRIPPALMLRGGEEKYMLKALGARYLPPELWQRRKFSFVAQGSPHLLRCGQDWVMDLLAPETVRRRGVFNPETVARLRAQYESPGFDLSQTFEDDYLMIVLTTEILMDAFDLTVA
ncbi:asparagine synthase (glutamine-hydrolysing) [Puniceibacterium sediminis]|uniref:asparagine synthase (glutamine-hydrolyzing) n=2 Tax=Puniceibacterium sediminis TaxID=1608407 RepID=A0A238ZB46_9RHOB|nr:asparagine synthase (glutamine-hydrolysing) [Puniceibacterium sediminis]